MLIIGKRRFGWLTGPRVLRAGSVLSGIVGAIFSVHAHAAVIEYFNPDLNNYFITADPVEQDFVDTGAVGQWLRTGYAIAAGGPNQVCRFGGNSTINPLRNLLWSEFALLHRRYSRVRWPQGNLYADRQELEVREQRFSDDGDGSLRKHRRHRRGHVDHQDHHQQCRHLPSVRHGAPRAAALQPQSDFGAIDPSVGGLTIDYNVDPPTYHGNGAATWTSVYTCPSGTFTATAPAVYLAGSKGVGGTEAAGTVSADGLTIEGSDTNQNVSMTWRFLAD